MRKIILGIDQSLSATGLCVVTVPDTNAGEKVADTVYPYEGSVISSPKSTKSFGKIDNIVNQIGVLIERHSPDMIAMEDYARMAQSASLTVLTELGGCIKHFLWKTGYSAENNNFFIQNQSQMKKAALGAGGTAKDSSYLLTVFRKRHIEFRDDNIADAYMHAWFRATIIRLQRGDYKVDDLPVTVRESIFTSKMKKRKITPSAAKNFTNEEWLSLL